MRWGAFSTGSTLSLSSSSAPSSCSTSSSAFSVGERLCFLSAKKMPVNIFYLQLKSGCSQSFFVDTIGFETLNAESETRPIFSEFSNERTRVERRENFRKLRMKENFFRAIDGYFDWISDAGTE